MVQWHWFSDEEGEMGYRAHVIKPGTIEEHAGGGHLNWRSSEILGLFIDNDVEYENKFRPFSEKWTVNASDLNRPGVVAYQKPNVPRIHLVN